LSVDKFFCSKTRSPAIVFEAVPAHQAWIATALFREQQETRLNTSKASDDVVLHLKSGDQQVMMMGWCSKKEPSSKGHESLCR
jgi:hypothetical protein